MNSDSVFPEAHHLLIIVADKWSTLYYEEGKLPMDIGGVIESAAARPLVDVQQGIALRVMKDQMSEQKDLVAEIINGPEQIASQIYNGHGQIVPTPSGSSVDARA